MAFSVPNLGIFLFFRKILLLGKFEGADLKHGNSLLKTLAQKYSNKAFLIPNLGIIIFSRNFVIRQFRGC